VKAGRSRKKSSRPRDKPHRGTANTRGEIPSSTGPSDQRSPAAPGVCATPPAQPGPPPVPNPRQPLTPLPQARASSAEFPPESADMDADGDRPDTQSADPQSRVDYHARLTQRLSALTQERSSLWGHVLNVFARKPDLPGDER
jgi:hypothetical protein